jgi:hypothetical protein
MIMDDESSKFIELGVDAARAEKEYVLKLLLS